MRISSPSISAKNTLVVGLGVTGWSVVRFLAAKGVAISVTDSRDITPFSSTLRQRYPGIQCSLGKFDEDLFNSAEEIIVSPGVALDLPQIKEARKAGKSVIGDVELFCRYATAPIAAITGSNGKTTVTTLLGEMATASDRNVAVGGNIGTPVLDLLTQNPDLYVLELSSFQLDLTESLRTETAVVLNVSPDHMDRHSSLQNYANTKFKIYRNCKKPVVNKDFYSASQSLFPSILQTQLKDAISYSVWQNNSEIDFGLQEKNRKRYLSSGAKTFVAADQLSIKGQHNISNALAALAMGAALGFDKQATVKALKNFVGLPHRCERVGIVDDVTFINDSKGTNVDASVKAIASIDGPVILIAGGDAKGADLSPLREAVKDRVRTVVILGKDAPEIESILDGVVETIRVASMSEAVREAFVHSEPGDTVLLSPACSSLDMYRNYEERGHAFTRAVQVFDR